MLCLWLPIKLPCVFSGLLAAKTMQMTTALQFQLCNSSAIWTSSIWASGLSGLGGDCSIRVFELSSVYNAWAGFNYLNTPKS